MSLPALSRKVSESRKALSSCTCVKTIHDDGMEVMGSRFLTGADAKQLVMMLSLGGCG